jgi:catechol 2,3-dioxygenase-like lactoylglutathione lyase family enzyme
MEKITHVALIVADQQEALDWYTEKLGWVVKSDEPFPGGMPGRWITVAPAGQTEIEVVLQPPEWGPEGDIESRTAQIGKGQGFVIVTDDCRAEAKTLAGRGVQFVSEPEEMPWGVSAVFLDLYGHAHNLLQPVME